MSNPLPITTDPELSGGRLPLHHPWRRVEVRRQHATRALIGLGVDLEHATEALAQSQRTDIIQLAPAANVSAALRQWDRAALAVLESQDLRLARSDLSTAVRLTAGLMRVADPCWQRFEGDQTRADVAMWGLYCVARRIELAAEVAAEKGGAK